MTSRRQSGKAGFIVWKSPPRPACHILIILFFVLGLASGLLSGPGALAASQKKAGVATDLAEEGQKGSPSRSVRLVVTLDEVDAARLENLNDTVEKLNGKVLGHFPRVGAMVLDLPLESVDALAETEGVTYIAPDREVTGLASHLDTTTGANLVYPGALSPGGYDGTGVTVVVIDSGINPGLWDLVDDVTKKRRVVLGMDFTGKGKIDDLFGHGSHVAGIIAGDGSSSSSLGKD